jgi:hypothetical protein
MRLPRMTTLRWMVVVAVVAVGCAAVVSVAERRRQRFARIADRHIAVFLVPAQVRDPERRSAIRLNWHSTMADKYLHAARYPWLPVEPDPPRP